MSAFRRGTIKPYGRELSISAVDRVNVDEVALLNKLTVTRPHFRYPG
jgi:hypothetical protein